MQVTSLFRPTLPGRTGLLQDLDDELVTATCWREVDAIDRLLALGASPNAVNNFNEIALHCAAGRSRVTVCERLLDAGAHVNALDARGASALYRAANSIHLVRLMLARGAHPDGMGYCASHGKWTSLHRAASRGDVDHCRALIDAGADVNFFTPDNGAPLHVAAYFGREPICELLVLKGARTDTMLFEHTPCMWARKKGFDRVSELIDAMDKSRQAAEAFERVMAQGNKGDLSPRAPGRMARLKRGSS